MKKLACIVLLMLVTGPVGFAAKRTEQATLKDVQPTNYGPANKKKRQQYDFSILVPGRSYQCRTLDNKTINATNFVVGSTVTFISNGKNGEVETAEGKKAKCTITRVANDFQQ
jgi:hypothetical protein